MRRLNRPIGGMVSIPIGQSVYPLPPGAIPGSEVGIGVVPNGGLNGPVGPLATVSHSSPRSLSKRPLKRRAHSGQAVALSRDFRALLLAKANLGSGLIDYSQKMTAAAMQIAEK
jgi:hypothetical protein